MRAILAGYGYLGSRIALEFAGAGFELTVLRRKTEIKTGIKFVEIDLMQQQPDSTLGQFDFAIFCLAPGTPRGDTYRDSYVLAQKNFLAGIRASRYLYVSSTAVYPDTPGTYAEGSACGHSPRAEILLEAEALALARDNACVLRLGGLYSRERPIYGDHRSWSGNDRPVHLIHRDDAARAVLHAVRHNLSGVYNVHDGHPLWRSEILSRLGLKAERHKPNSGRWISAEKFSETGFNPIYADYFAGRSS